MANPEHLNILKRGDKAWNAWRKENPTVRPELTEVNLADANLSKTNLTGADLTGAILTEAYLRGAHLRGADLGKANLTKAYLRGADLRRANLEGVKNLTQAQLNQACVDENTTLPKDLTRPKPCSEEELPKR